MVDVVASVDVVAVVVGAVVVGAVVVATVVTGVVVVRTVVGDVEAVVRATVFVVAAVADTAVVVDVAVEDGTLVEDAVVGDVSLVVTTVLCAVVTTVWIDTSVSSTVDGDVSGVKNITSTSNNTPAATINPASVKNVGIIHLGSGTSSSSVSETVAVSSLSDAVEAFCSIAAALAINVGFAARPTGFLRA